MKTELQYFGAKIGCSQVLEKMIATPSYERTRKFLKLAEPILTDMWPSVLDVFAYEGVIDQVRDLAM